MKRAWWLGFLALAGCGGNGAQQQNPLSMPTSSVPSSRKAADADPQVETKMVTAKAATIKFDKLKATIAVPEAAVEKTTNLTGQIPVDIKDVKDLVPKTLVAFSGPTFAKPVELTLPKPKKKGELSLVEWKDKKWVATEATLDTKKNLFKLTTATLGTYAVLVKPKEAKKPETKEEAKPATPATEPSQAPATEPAKEASERTTQTESKP